MEFRTSGFFVSFPVVSEGKPECHKQDANDGDCGYPPAKGSPVELEPGGSSGLVNILKLLPLDWLLWLTGGCWEDSLDPMVKQKMD